MWRAGVVFTLLVAGIPAAHAQVDPPTVVAEAIRTLDGPVIFRFDREVIGVTDDNVTVQVQGGAVVNGTRTCRNADTPVPCATGPATVVEFRASSPLVSGQVYDAKVNPDGAAPVSDGVNPVPSYRRALRAPSHAEENSPGALHRWRRVRWDGAGGNVAYAERAAGARVTYRFSGDRVTWITTTGPYNGKARIYIDGRLITELDTGGRRVSRVGRTWTGLGEGAHRLEIVVSGRSGRGRGSWVYVDGFRTNLTVDENAATYAWPRIRYSGASAGAYSTTPTPGTVIEFRFKGRGVDWITSTGPDQGIARIVVDGKTLRTFDNYSSRQRNGVRRTITNLTDAVHRVAVVVTGTKNRSSRGYGVKVDAFTLRAAILAFKGNGAWMDRFDYSNTCGWIGGGGCAKTFVEAAQFLKDRGIRTLYIQTGHHKSGAFRWPTGVGAWLDAAQSRGIKVVGWYLPRYDEIGTEVTNTAAIASFRSGSGRRFDGLGIDIEDRTDPDTNAHLTRSAFFRGISDHLRLVRAKVGVSYPIASIPFAPLDMDIWPGGWDGFPWDAVGRYSDIVIPMSYWSNRYDRCRGTGSHASAGPDTRYCVANYTRENVTRTKALTGLPVHVAGGVMTHPDLGPSDVRAFVSAAEVSLAYGRSLYDARTTSSSEWTALAGG